MVSTVNVNGVSATEQLTTILARAAVFLNLRDTLTKYGISPEEKVAVSLEIVETDPVGILQNKLQARYEDLPKGRSGLGLTVIDKSFEDAISDDFLVPAGVMFNLNDEFLKAHGVADPLTVNKIRYKLTLEVGSNPDELKSKIEVFAFCVLCPSPVLWCAG